MPTFICLFLLSLLMVPSPLLAAPKDIAQSLRQDYPKLKFQSVSPGPIAGFYQVVVDQSEIETRLPRMLAAAKQRVLYFDAHDDVDYGTAVEVMDKARAGGARSIAILTKTVVH